MRAYLSRIITIAALYFLVFNPLGYLYCCATVTPHTTAELSPLNVIMLIDIGGREEAPIVANGIYGNMMARLHDALIQCSEKTPAIIIASTSILHYLAKFNIIDPSKHDFEILSQFWNTYLQPDNSFCSSNDPSNILTKKKLTIMIPKVFSALSLAELNLNENLELIKPEQLVQTFIDEQYECTLFYSRLIDECFKASNCQRPKRIYLAGHGNENWDIAGITFTHYQETLQILDTKNTELLYEASCYASGNNLLLSHNLAENQLHPHTSFILESISFPMIIGAVTDAPQFKEDTEDYIGKFFQAADHFLDKHNIDYNHAVTKFLEELHTLMPYRNNIPLIRHAMHKIFRAMPLSDTTVLTFPAHQSIRTAIKPKLPVLTVGKEKSSLLIYPVKTLGITIHTATAPLFISMIPGTAQHYLQQIQSDTDYYHTISNLFCKPLTQTGRFVYNAQQPKAWFIEKLTDPNQTIGGLVIHKQECMSSSWGKFDVLFQAFNNYYRHDANGHTGLGFEKTITRQAYYDEIVKIHAQTHATPEAITFATDGKESSEDERTGFQHFVATCMPGLYRSIPSPIATPSKAKAAKKSTPTQKQPQPAPARSSTLRIQPAVAAKASATVAPKQLVRTAAIYHFSSNKKSPTRTTKR